ncbi:MazG nucleotide pyrophosphohydrolase domain-containing protein [Streptomonospora arabica]|uniref:MazG nucleotide pyrophosphohydrolase domain-containing protein n=1 Tax=Streptomonospora arabica TaxID=412417 RepID=A0ABV9SSH2_9ACTN
MSHLDDAIDARRRHLGLKRWQLAHRAGVDPATIANLARGATVRPRTAARVEAALGWEPGSLASVAAGGMPRVAGLGDDPVPDVVADLFTQMGIDGQPPRECVAHLCEEVGELAKATRTGDRANLAEEVGDVGILLHRIAALYGIDVDQAVREKAASRLERHRRDA